MGSEQVESEACIDQRASMISAVCETSCLPESKLQSKRYSMSLRVPQGSFCLTSAVCGACNAIACFATVRSLVRRANARFSDDFCQLARTRDNSRPRKYIKSEPGEKSLRCCMTVLLPFSETSLEVRAVCTTPALFRQDWFVKAWR